MMMITISLLLSVTLLVAANVIAYRSKTPTAKVVCLCLGFLLVPQFFNFFSPPVALLAVLLLLAVVIWRELLRGPSSFRGLSLVATMIAFAVPVMYALKDARLRARYPYESLEARLPASPAARAMPVSSQALDRLDQLEVRMGRSYIRSHRLMMLHERSVEIFVRHYGFGVTRMVPGPSAQNLALEGRDGPDILQPGPPAGPPRSPGEWLRLPATDEEPLARLHEFGIYDFAFPESFGYVKDRRHVAGFKPHRLSHVPETSPRGWQVRTLDLVGLLLNDEPRVYVSAHLPRMGALRGVPTRPLDKFEMVGLTAIKNGDDLLSVRDGDAIRMVGAIRSVKSCVTCHGGERGDLLGAFTYVLQLDEKSNVEPRPGL